MGFKYNVSEKTPTGNLVPTGAMYMSLSSHLIAEFWLTTTQKSTLTSRSNAGRKKSSLLAAQSLHTFSTGFKKKFIWCKNAIR